MSGKIIKTDKSVEFCSGCNNQIKLKKFIQVDEDEAFDKAWERRNENEGDELFKHERFMGFCLCGNIYIT